MGKGSRVCNFACSCPAAKEGSEELIGCQSAWKWIHLAFERNNKTFDYEKYKEQYEVSEQIIG